MWSVASLENTEANEEYSGGSVGFGLDFSAAAASSVAVVSLAMIGGRVKRDSCHLVSTEKEQKSSWDWSRDSLMERVLSIQLIVGLSSFNQGSPRIMFSFPRFMM